jgi:nucleoside-diphosphate-sugar epimerase
MRILIAGGTSALAQALKPALAGFAEVVTAGRQACDVRLDLADPAPLQLPAGIDVVINTAAAFGGKSPRDLLHTEQVNVLGALRLAAACTEATVGQLVQISSIFAGLDKDSGFYSIYSLSKSQSDAALDLYSTNFNLPLTILRPSQFYGVGPAQRKHQPFLSMLIDKAAAGDAIQFYGSRDALRNFIHVEDVAHVIALIIQRRVLGCFDCAAMQNISYTEVASAAIAAFGSRSTITFLKDKPDIPDNIFAADDRLYRLLDFYPQISMAEGMRKEAAYRKLTS